MIAYARRTLANLVCHLINLHGFFYHNLIEIHIWSNVIILLMYFFVQFTYYVFICVMSRLKHALLVLSASTSSPYCIESSTGVT